MDTYNERDIKAILNRAFELQQRFGNYSGTFSHREELTLEEVKEIARELGVPADFVREAALEYEGIPVEEPLFLDTGNNSEIELVGFTRGELSKKTWTELRTVIEQHFGCPGKVKRRPHSIIWKAQPGGLSKYIHNRKSTVVQVSSSNSTSTIRIKKSVKTFNKSLYPAYAASIVAAMMLGVLLNSSSEAAPFLVVIAILSGTAKLFHTWTNNKKQKARENLKDFMEQLQTVVTRQFKASSQSGKFVDREIISFGEETTTPESESASDYGKQANRTR